MKKLLFLSGSVLIYLSGFAADLGDSWVMVDKGRMECKRINMGYNKARLILTNGEKTTVQVNDIRSYAMDGKVYSKMPLYRDNKPTGQNVFMELIKSKGNLSVYKYENSNWESINLNDKMDSYFVYDGNKMLLPIDENSMPNISMIFGLRYSYQ